MITLKVSARTLMALKKLRKGLSDVNRELDDRHEPLDTIKKKQVQRWDVNFTSEGAEYGGWEALKETTLEDRDRKGFASGPILVRTGSLFVNFLSQSEAGDVSRSAVHWNFVDSEPSHPVFHSLGGWSVLYGAKVPARVLWTLDAKDEQRAQDVMDDWVDDVIAIYF